ncbi:MAG: TolC family protein [Bryobacteraceae bacterium]
MGPNYRRPAISVPDGYRASSGQTTTGTPNTPSFGDTRWPEIFQDAELQRLLKTALDNNYDVRIAAARIEQAAANVGIVRSDQFPNAGADAGYSRTKSSAAAAPFVTGFSG